MIRSHRFVAFFFCMAGIVAFSLSAAAQVDRAFKLTYGRAASAEEQKLADDFLAKQTPIMVARLASTDAKPPLPASLPQGIDPARAAAFVDLCHMLLDSNEFLYIN